jgi:acyl-coenzyme A synthetase/AMP-(fatty) acid ligase
LIRNEDVQLSWDEYSLRVVHYKEKFSETKGDELILLSADLGLDFFAAILGLSEIGIAFAPVENYDPATLQQAGQIFGSSKITIRHNVYLLSLNSPLARGSCVLFTSGSSGVPKAIVHKAKSLMLNAKATLRETKISKRDRLFVCQRYHFTSAICHFLSAYLSGASIYLSKTNLMPKDYISALNWWRPTVCGGSPLQLAWIARSSLSVNGSIKRFFSSGDDLAEEIGFDLLERFPAAMIFSAYGLTEVSGRGCMVALEKGRKLVSVGSPIFGLKIRIASGDEDGFGEIFYAGDYLYEGFYQGGLYRKRSGTEIATGDIGFIDGDGDLNIVGRNDDVYKVSGKKVSGLSIARALKSISCVNDAHVIFEKDVLVGHVPCAYVSLTEACSRRFIFAKLRDRLPTSSMPQQLYQIEAIPRSGAGKIMRKKFYDLSKSATSLS